MTLSKSVWVLWKPSPSLSTTSCRSIGVEYWKINPNGRRIWRKFVRLCLSSSRYFHVNLPRQLSIPSPSRKFRAFCRWPVDELTVYRLPRIIVPPLPLSPSSLPFIPPVKLKCNETQQNWSVTIQALKIDQGTKLGILWKKLMFSQEPISILTWSFFDLIGKYSIILRARLPVSNILNNRLRPIMKKEIIAPGYYSGIPC